MKNDNFTKQSNASKPMLANRLLKFRAFSNKDKAMYYGRKVELITSSDYVYCRILLNRSIDNPHNEYDMNGLLTQFTGLKDRKGVDIYEGDVLKANNSVIEIVFSGRGYEGVYLNKEEKHETPIKNNNYLHWEVIGNVFENPELLTQS